MSEAFLHYSAVPLDTLVVKDQRTEEYAGAFTKPRGLWVSVEGEYDWLEWCMNEEFNLGGFKYVYEVKLKETANILYLRSAEDIDSFTDKYITLGGPPGFVEKLIEAGIPPMESAAAKIDWNKVIKEYDGIVITPYCWERRMARHTTWYYGWDCASGCIWNINALDRARRVFYLRKYVLNFKRVYNRNISWPIRSLYWRTKRFLISAKVRMTLYAYQVSSWWPQ